MASPNPTHGEAEFSPRYSNYVLGVLFLAYVFNFIDRQIISILLEPIKAELEVTDTLMGFLTGPAFAIFYATLGIPIARWADSGVRRSIIAMGTALWSLMTAASGMAQSFFQMSLARIGVGVGEAALSPPAHSLLADYFPVERRATALGVYSMGIHIGILFGVLAGGWLEEFWGWRMAFVVVGLPGLLIALLVRFTVREPVRASAGDLPSVGEVVSFLWSLRSFRHLAFATGLVAFAGYAFATWAPTFLRRVHDMSGGELGTKYGLVLGVGGAIGSVLAGIVADRLGKNDRRWWLRVPAFAAAGPMPFLLLFFFLPDPNWALACAFPGLIIGAMYQGPVFSTVQTLVHVRMRAVASGILLFVINIIGLGLGPQSIGLLNDHVFDAYGDEAIRYSLTLVFVVMGTWASVHYLLGARALREDLGAVSQRA